jgi:lipid II:glycine glycyltransferase (peptidoglycan interpeptide bridge formation enzyme)
MRDFLFPEKMARLFFAEYNGVKIGALINFYYKDTIYLGHTSVLRGEYNDLNAYKLLIWHSIVDGKSNNFKNLDLTGLHPDESHGQYRFKMGFNGQVKEIGEYTKSYRYNEVKHMKKIINQYRKHLVVKCYAIGVFNHLNVSSSFKVHFD